MDTFQTKWYVTNTSVKKQKIKLISCVLDFLQSSHFKYLQHRVKITSLVRSLLNYFLLSVLINFWQQNTCHYTNFLELTITPIMMLHD